MALKGLEFGGLLLDLLSFSKILRASSRPFGWTPEEEEEEETQNSTCSFFFPICDLLKRHL